ncbi:Lecithin:cholesterol acyltransferase-domain-containing protein [Protomyces lactucae-debilis]|uniref:Lecithin:cholesterol acyltransferase-domain-containing protein n=1 Tax=Protomyces lactucae-debilis TaxID=2754530 RepID=A0A1Y2F7H0_PROLT|nr:Lecithin:cholesterol acyltransferase-domain-containing protein [Protomyces lactucae-debilis]ORY79434.1 Lecithin:cholesterol acyltransferase-domain-containing protein [Protomyces lactucae-debilis]
MADHFDADMYDDNMPMPDASAPPTGTTDVSMTDPTPRTEALYIAGVEHLSTRDVGDWVALFYDAFLPKIEWIDDHSLNLVMKTPEDATELLRQLVDGNPTAVTTTQTLPAKIHADKPNVALTVRRATSADVKPPRAAERSRWYLLHPEDERRNTFNRVERQAKRSSRTTPYDTSRRRKEPRDTRSLAERLHLPLDNDEQDLLDLRRDKEARTEAAGGDVFAARIAEAEEAARRRPAAVRQAEKQQMRKTLPKGDLMAGLRALPAGGREKSRLTLAERLHGKDKDVDLLAGVPKERDLLETQRPASRQMQIKDQGLHKQASVPHLPFLAPNSSSSIWATSSSPNCTAKKAWALSAYFAYCSESDPDDILLFENYASKADCDKHFKTDKLKEFGAVVVGECLKSDLQMNYYEPVMGFLGRGEVSVPKGQFVWLAELKCHDAEARDAIFEAAGDLIRYVHDNEPSTLAYLFLKSVDDEAKLTVFEIYESRAALFDVHHKSEAFKEFGGRVGRHVMSKESTGYYTVDGGWLAKDGVDAKPPECVIPAVSSAKRNKQIKEPTQHQHQLHLQQMRKDAAARDGHQATISEATQTPQEVPASKPPSRPPAPRPKSTRTAQRPPSHKAQPKRPWGRRWFLIAGACIGVLSAMYFAKDKIDLTELGLPDYWDELSARLPDRVLKEVTRMSEQRAKSAASDHNAFSVGRKLKNEGLSLAFPLVMLPGVISTGLESWSTEGCAAPFYRKRLWGSWSMLRCMLTDKACWTKQISLDPISGLDPADGSAKLRAATGFDATDFFITGYWIWNKILENVSALGGEPNNMFTAAYDWRLSFSNLENRDHYFTKLKLHIESANLSTGKKTVLVSHSMGSQVLFYFMKWVEHEKHGNGGKDWVNRHIDTWINISGSMLGTPKAVAALVSGEMKDTAQLNAFSVYGLETFFSRKERAQILRTLPGIASMLPKGGDRIWGTMDSAPDDPELRNGSSFGNFFKFKTPATIDPDSDSVIPGNMTMDKSMEYLLQHTDHHFHRMLATNYSHGIADTLEEVLANNDKPEKWINPLETALPDAPDMKIFCMYGIGKPTERTYYYETSDFEQQNLGRDMLQDQSKNPRDRNVTHTTPMDIPFVRSSFIDNTVTNKQENLEKGVQMGEGDGTVALLSSGYMCAHAWKEIPRFNPSKIPIKVYEMQHEEDLFDIRGGPKTADHVDILGRPELSELILRVAAGHGEQIEEQILSEIVKYSRRIDIQ